MEGTIKERPYRKVIDEFLKSIHYDENTPKQFKISMLTGFITGAYDCLTNEEIGYNYTYEEILDGFLYGMYQILGVERKNET